MPASFQEILNSRIFKFTVGEEADGVGTEFQVHEEAIAQLSAPLLKMMKGGTGGGFSEAQAGSTAWKDVKKGIFERFVQFAYSGDYSIPEPIIPAAVTSSLASRSRSSSIMSRRSSRASRYDQVPTEPVDAPMPEDVPLPSPAYYSDGDGFSSIPFKRKERRTMKDDYPNWKGPMLAENFHMLSYPVLAPRNKYTEDCNRDRDFKHGHSYVNVFLSHATLYVLCDLWLVDSLKALALFKLHQTLCVFKLDDGNVDDVLELARYAYRDEGKGCEEGIGDLRNMVCQYMTLNAVVLTLDGGFMELLAEGGQFVKDLWVFEVQRIHF